MLGKPVSASEGKELGFVYEVCPKQALQDRTQALSNQLASGPTYAYGLMKKLLYEAQFTGFDAYLKEEIAAQYACGFTADYRNGITSFLEKREPEFFGN